MSTDPVARLEELETELRTRKEALSSRIQSLLNESGDSELPQLHVLREDRVRLMEEIQHNKDEGDALLLQGEGNGKAALLYRVAARVQRFEEFVGRAEDYVKAVLPEEIERIAESDKLHSEDEVAAYINELQVKREEELRKIALLKERTAKRAQDMRNGPRVEHGELNAYSRVAKAKEEELDKETKEMQEYTDAAKIKKSVLLAKIKELRQAKSKLQVELLDNKHKNEKIVNDIKIRIRHAELSNTRDIRVCQQLNTGNAALTTNAQTLLGQLNVEHYGIEGAPSDHALLTMRKEEKKRALAAVASNHNNNNGSSQAADGEVDVNSKGAYKRHSTQNSNGSKPPMAAFKRTESQRNREAAVLSSMSQRREGGSSAPHSRTFSKQMSQGSEPSHPRGGSLHSENSKNCRNSRDGSQGSGAR
ncbi:putative OSM3-like kinesin [Trypanosoma rangeli]|uniref:Putative OSM3-like kinesin n=1 Tax=Trypanosoma rangeli TaxID=5698 RepID=A0A422P039_TRYRA|nr:putative OSM3-like kinesin [Trypanosoma rangeli]RNF11112.1 putative OSM3-like kinesin [Trypanosoma rangeli]|eukprot:RNF11112.1 putative OSM3-like kinesin [Trypanosoma rangeli]